MIFFISALVCGCGGGSSSSGEPKPITAPNPASYDNNHSDKKTEQQKEQQKKEEKEEKAKARTNYTEAYLYFKRLMKMRNTKTRSKQTQSQPQQDNKNKEPNNIDELFHISIAEMAKRSTYSDSFVQTAKETTATDFAKNCERKIINQNQQLDQTTAPDKNNDVMVFSKDNVFVLVNTNNNEYSYYDAKKEAWAPIHLNEVTSKIFENSPQTHSEYLPPELCVIKHDLSKVGKVESDNTQQAPKKEEKPAATGKSTGGGTGSSWDSVADEVIPDNNESSDIGNGGSDSGSSGGGGGSDDGNKYGPGYRFMATDFQSGNISGVILGLGIAGKLLENYQSFFKYGFSALYRHFFPSESDDSYATLTTPMTTMLFEQTLLVRFVNLIANGHTNVSVQPLMVFSIPFSMNTVKEAIKNLQKKTEEHTVIMPVYYRGHIFTIAIHRDAKGNIKIAYYNSKESASSLLGELKKAANELGLQNTDIIDIAGGQTRQAINDCGFHTAWFIDHIIRYGFDKTVQFFKKIAQTTRSGLFGWHRYPTTTFNEFSLVLRRYYAKDKATFFL